MKVKVHALTSGCECISNRITSPVEIIDPFTGAKTNTSGIWDTGATNSVVTKSTAATLGLKPVTRIMVNGVHGPKEVNVYHVEIILNNKEISLKTQVTECEELSCNNQDGMLIGMDIINKGDFAVTNSGGRTVMSFRVPSLQVIDFVEGINCSNPLIKAKLPSRNDPCPCKSGKKYKHCCGKDQ